MQGQMPSAQKYNSIINKQRKGPMALMSAKSGGGGGGHPVYVKNLMSHGLHMPSKGLFSQKALRKPATANAYGNRGNYSSQ